ncbi:DUF2799 domain-containing protein [Hahella sp. HN01]|uniref:DUF2799 domain-containing protein n=1 Tax=unclassified Hahella TaxID=2624107 RepID=UPI001C1EBC2F|nr:DUF2799 domain-containing protein [Hahella sp. HN01]MBU6951081.1 DUF2799 domain-containing protein [Hahella sp. HN01]
MVRRIFVVAALLNLSACATMNENECRNADWRVIGYEDGVAGRSATYLSQHREACSDYNVSPDLDAYRAGFDDGARNYCKPQNGFDLGRGGNAYKGQCPPDLEPVFMRAVESGQFVRYMEKEIKDSEGMRTSAEKDLDKNRDKIDAIENELVNGSGDAQKRRDLLKQMRELENHRDDLNYELRHLDAKIREYRSVIDSIIVEQPWMKP